MSRNFYGFTSSSSEDEDDALQDWLEENAQDEIHDWLDTYAKNIIKSYLKKKKIFSNASPSSKKKSAATPKKSVAVKKPSVKKPPVKKTVSRNLLPEFEEVELAPTQPLDVEE